MAKKVKRPGFYYWFEVLLGISIGAISYYCMVWHFGFSMTEMIILAIFHGFWAGTICYIIRFGKPPYHLLGAFLSSLIVGFVFHYNVFAMTNKVQPVLQELHCLKQQKSVSLKINDKALNKSAVDKFIKLVKSAEPYSGTTSRAGLTHGSPFSLTIILSDREITFGDCYYFKESRAPDVLFITSRQYLFPLYITFTIPNGRGWAKRSQRSLTTLNN